MSSVSLTQDAIPNVQPGDLTTIVVSLTTQDGSPVTARVGDQLRWDPPAGMQILRIVASGRTTVIGPEATFALTTCTDTTPWPDHVSADLRVSQRAAARTHTGTLTLSSNDSVLASTSLQVQVSALPPYSAIF
ncbi:hypothetical protein ACSNOI_03320 [Actinomadura kijaniata]|uniref:hypothetical protein n=1 Tax=Actinomadura kijaniata TaxID=46161 RepID=UPI003F1B10E6